MKDIIPDRWAISLPAEALTARLAADNGRLNRLATLEPERMHDSLAFLAGYAPGILDAILTATEPCLDDLFPADDDALEPYCTECGAKAGIFIGLGSEWMHYQGDPQMEKVLPYDPGHAPVIGWRPAESTVAVVAL